MFDCLGGNTPLRKETLLEIRDGNFFTVWGHQITQFAPVSMSVRNDCLKISNFVKLILKYVKIFLPAIFQTSKKCEILLPIILLATT